MTIDGKCGETHNFSVEEVQGKMSNCFHTQNLQTQNHLDTFGTERARYFRCSVDMHYHDMTFLYS